LPLNATVPTSTFSRNRRIILATARGLARGLVRRPSEFRRHVIRDTWTIAKRFGASGIQNIEFRDIPFLYGARVEGYVDDHQRAIIAALVSELGARTFFEIGTSLGRQAWTVAHHAPGVQLWTLDVPPSDAAENTALELGPDDRTYFRPVDRCGEAFRGTDESERITQLWGDSATFDYSPYAGQMDFVYVDGAHSYEYVRSDTGRALEMLSPQGTIVWDDYVTSPGVYEYLGELAPTLDGPIYHLIGTRMAFYSRQRFVKRTPRDNFPFG
jgi:predicted O-methyltransferase YrrM